MEVRYMVKYLGARSSSGEFAKGIFARETFAISAHPENRRPLKDVSTIGDWGNSIFAPKPDGSLMVRTFNANPMLIEHYDPRFRRGT